MTSFAPLMGIRVVDFSKILAGPLCTQYLGDLGADVIKIEPCAAGDDTRGWPPFAGGDGGDGGVFLSCNGNKRSIALDLKHEQGRKIATRLIAKADVLVESYRKGAMTRLGLGYEAVRTLNPRIVYASITGFGSTGPLSNLPGYDLMVQAFSGIMSITGERGGGPVRSAFSPIDQTTGIWTALGIVAALRERDRTNDGRYIEASLFETALAFLGYTAQNFWVSGRVPERVGSGHESLCPYQAFLAADGHILIAVGNDKLWVRFCDAVNLQEFANNPKFAKNADRVAHFDETVALVASSIRRHSIAHWVKVLNVAGVPNSPINTIDKVLDMEHTHARGMVFDYVDPHRGPQKGVSMPISFDGQSRPARRAPPKLGESTRAILSELGYTESEIDGLLELGIASSYLEAR
jgi:crotonobetainyl-CoA:carnitine CoA-transferase CaiB-like acyl-CoA transferase